MVKKGTLVVKAVRFGGLLLVLVLAACGSANAPRTEPSVGQNHEQKGESKGEHGKMPHWGYTGDVGPENWGKLDHSFATCDTGKSQSPIDIQVVQAKSKDVPDVTFNYKPAKIKVVNNGHTIQDNYEAGSYIEVEGQRYDLVQFHFHTPSEHAVDGKLAAMELHLVHKSAENKLTVVGVLINEGAENAALEPLWKEMPKTEGPEKEVVANVDAAGLLPTEHLTYRYTGSLTTPPCTEGVNWLVITKPIEASAAQIKAFQAIFDHDNRPLQPLNEREIIVDSSAG